MATASSGLGVCHCGCDLCWWLASGMRFVLVACQWLSSGIPVANQWQTPVANPKDVLWCRFGGHSVFHKRINYFLFKQYQTVRVCHCGLSYALLHRKRNCFGPSSRVCHWGWPLRLGVCHWQTPHQEANQSGPPCLPHSVAAWAPAGAFATGLGHRTVAPGSFATNKLRIRM